MSITINEADRKCLERLARRKTRPTKRQKARGLLGLAAGEDVDSIAMRVGLTREDLMALAAQFNAAGLEGIGLARRRRQESHRFHRHRYGTVEKTPMFVG
jgi:hypothetical protein